MSRLLYRDQPVDDCWLYKPDSRYTPEVVDGLISDSVSKSIRRYKQNMDLARYANELRSEFPKMSIHKLSGLSFKDEDPILGGYADMFYVVSPIITNTTLSTLVKFYIVDKNNNLVLVPPKDYLNSLIVGILQSTFSDVKELGADYILWSNAPENPLLN